MSSRRKVDPRLEHAKVLQKELNDLKKASIEATSTDNSAKEAVASEVPAFDSLNRTEQAAASLGVNPDAWSEQL
tara:strand:- start:3988 stop:4209 length:222 start_codon:yes stop_codon:yes gene_type:complete